MVSINYIPTQHKLTLRLVSSDDRIQAVILPRKCNIDLLLVENVFTAFYNAHKFRDIIRITLYIYVHTE